MSEKSIPECKPKTVFVVSPIGSPGSIESVKASHALEYIIRQALPLPDWDVKRADEEPDPGSITHMVIKRIIESDLIVADLTDHNPNVFYELAVAHGYRKPVVTIITEGQMPPFDIVDLRTVFYDLTNPASVHEAKIRLADSARAALDTSDPNRSRATNPLAVYEMFPSTNNQQDGSSQQLLDFGLAEILRRLNHIEARLEESSSNPDSERISRFAIKSLRPRDPYLDGQIAEMDEQIAYIRNKLELTDDDRARLAHIEQHRENLRMTRAAELRRA